MSPRSETQVRAAGAASAGGGAPGAFALLRRKWCPFVLLALAGRPSRFNEIKRALPGMASKPLSECLKFMRSLGLVAGGPAAPGPGRDDPGAPYSLTPPGHALAGAVRGLITWTGKTLAPQGDERRGHQP